MTIRKKWLTWCIIQLQTIVHLILHLCWSYVNLPNSPLNWSFTPAGCNCVKSTWLTNLISPNTITPLCSTIILKWCGSESKMKSVVCVLEYESFLKTCRPLTIIPVQLIIDDLCRSYWPPTAAWDFRALTPPYSGLFYS